MRRLLYLALVAGLMAAAVATRQAALRIHDELNADEALPGLMARHIAFGGERPVFYYGQHYFGAAEAYLTAALFRQAGIQADLLYAIPIGASVLLVPTAYALGASGGGPLAGLVAAALVAAPPPILARLYANAGGGFSLAFLLHNVLLLLAIRALRSSRWPALWLALGSLVAGPLIWIWQPAAPLYAALVVLVIARRRQVWWPHWLLLGVAPVAVGLLPPVAYNVANHWVSMTQLLDKYAAPANEASAGPNGTLRAVAGYLMTAVGGGNEIEGGANLPQATSVLLASVLALPLAARIPLRTRTGRSKGSAVAVLALALVVDVAAAHNTVRHLAPAALDAFAMAGVGVGLLVTRRRLAGIPVALLTIAVTAIQTSILWRSAPATFAHFVARRSEAAEAVAQLDRRGLRTGYTDYWSAYPITYLAGERIVLAPSVPVPFGGRFDRYPAYTKAVDAVSDPGAIFMLLDDTCSPLPYIVVLEQTEAAYQLEHVARWYLLWNIQPRPEGDGQTLARWRKVMYDRHYC